MAASVIGRAFALDALVGCDLEDALDLDRDVEGQLGHTHSGPGMDTCVTEDIVHELAAAVDHRRRLVEPGSAVDHAEDFHDANDPIERSQPVSCGSEQLQTGEAGGGEGLIDIKITTDFPRDKPRVRDRTMSADVKHVIDENCGNVEPGGRHGCGECDSCRRQSRFMASIAGRRIIDGHNGLAVLG